MNIYILSEITKRELDANILVAVIAAKNGGSVLISNMDTIEYLSTKNLINKGIFHTKGILHDDRKQNLHVNLFNNGFKITSLDEENGLVKKDLGYFCRTRFSEESLKYADKIFCWGNHDYDHLTSTYKKLRNKFFKTGAPRTDLWKKKFRSYWKDENDIKKKKQVLISLNFGLINGFESFEKQIKKLKKAEYFKRSKDFEKEIFEMYDQNKKDFAYFKELINFISDELKDVYFIIRPHPREKASTWKKILNKNSNLIINNDGNFNKVLSDTDILIQNGCTTAFQAAIYEIPIISYVVEDNLEIHGKTANQLGIQLSTKEKVKNTIREYFIGKKVINVEVKEILDNKLFMYENELSSFKIFREWAELSKNIFFKKNNWRWIKFKLFWLDLKNIFKKDNKFEKLNVNNINNKINRLKKILKHFKKNELPFFKIKDVKLQINGEIIERQQKLDF